MAKTLILGIGNILLKDEGIGVRVVERLQKMDLPGDVDAVDGNALGPGLIHVIRRANRLIVVDALAGGGIPGTLYRLIPEDIKIRPCYNFSLHHENFLQVLTLAEKTGYRPPAVIIGVEPKEIDFGLELSPEIERQIPKIIDLVLKELCCNA